MSQVKFLGLFFSTDVIEEFMREFHHLLGKVSDSEIARNYGLCRERVRQIREKHNIPKFSKVADVWNDENIALLGKMPDLHVAKKLNIGSHFVTRKRKELNIPKYNVWTDEALQLLGTDSDPNIAKKLNVGKTTVFNKRKMLNIPQCKEKHNRWNPRVKWNEDLDNLLGKISDGELARKLGVDYYIVYNRRVKLGIPRFSKRNKSYEN